MNKIREETKPFYTKDYTDSVKTKKTSEFLVNEDELNSMCKDFDTTIESMVNDYKDVSENIWNIIKNSSINPLGIKCLPIMCKNLMFNKIEKVISLVDDKGKNPNFRILEFG